MHALLGSLVLAFVPYQTDGGVNLHWLAGAAPPVLVSATPAGGLDAEAMRGAIAAALTTWQTIACPDLDATRATIDERPALPAPTVGDAALDDLDGTISFVWMSDVAAWNARFGSKELARTLLSHRHVSGEIVDADVAVNFGAFLFASDAACAPDRYDLLATLTHEVGHVIGLDHSTVATATMASKSEVGECDKRDLDPDDVAGFCAIYTHLAPIEPDPGPEPEPVVEVVVESAAEAEATHGRDDGCGGAGAGGLATAVAAVALALTRARRASGGCRRGPRPSPARS